MRKIVLLFTLLLTVSLGFSQNQGAASNQETKNEFEVFLNRKEGDGFHKNFVSIRCQTITNEKGELVDETSNLSNLTSITLTLRYIQYNGKVIEHNILLPIESVKEIKRTTKVNRT